MNKKIFIERLGDLVAIPSTTDNVRANTQALTMIKKWSDKRCNQQVFTNGHAKILLIGSGNILKPKIGYLVHVDVVPGHTNQFKMIQRGRNLIGRGVNDMKFSIPIGIELINQALKNGLDKDITIAVTTDEESGGNEGGKYLAQTLNFHPEILIVPDGGDNFRFVNKSKGVVHLLIESKGQPAHASQPWLGKNALSPLCRLANILLERYDNNSQQENWETTMNLGHLYGGNSANQVCSEAVLKLDFRFPETRSVNEIFYEVKNMAVSIDPSLQVSVTAAGDPTTTDISLQPVQKLMKAARMVLGKNLVVKGDYGASDARYWAKYHIPILMTKPKGGGCHSDHEWINLDSCLKFYEIMWKYLTI